jgi:DNA-binding CsgD family transcriptional regulator
MRFYLVLASAVAVSCIYLGIVGLQGSNKKKSRRLFFFMCLSMAWFLFCAGWSVSETDRASMLAWYRLSSFGFAPFFALNLHFYIRFVHEPKNSRLLSLLYLPVPAVLLSTLFSRSLYGNFALAGGHWRFFPALDSPWFWLYIAYYVPTTAATILIMLGYGKRSGSKKRRRQAGLIAGISGVTLFVGSGFDFVLPAFSWYTLPPFGPLVMAVYILGLWYALLRCDFLGPFSSPLLDEALDNIDDIVCVLDPSCRVVKMNNPGKAALALPAAGEDGAYFPDLTADPQTTETLLGSLSRNGTHDLAAVIEYRTNSGVLRMDSQVSKILDPQKDLDGFLVVSRENTGRKEFSEKFKITDREMEIIDLCLAGQGNPDIARKLGISVRTVETHLTNIYNKCGTDNKIELFNLGRNYSLLPDLIKKA